MATRTGNRISDTALRRRAIFGFVIFAAVLVGGLAAVKWAPLTAKMLAAMSSHSVGSSIVSGSAASPASTGWSAALQYALAYYGAVWRALLLALIAGATLHVFVPRSWVHRLLGDTGFRSVAIAGTLSLVGMM